MKRLFKIISVGLISLILMLAVLPFSATAAEVGTITLKLSECQVRVPDPSTKISVYQIAGYSDTGQLEITSAFEATGIEITDLFSATALQMNDIAKEFQEYVLEKNPDCMVYDARAGVDSTVSVGDNGVYLILIDRIFSTRYAYDFSPMICQIPSPADSGEFDYDLEIIPKYSINNDIVTVTATVTSTTTATSFTSVLATGTSTSSASDTQTTTTTTVTSESTSSETVTASGSSTTQTTVTTTTKVEDKLPQTGTMIWVVYILAGIGIIFLITLWGVCRKDSSGKSTKITMLIIGCLCVGSAAAMYAQPIFVERASVPVMSMAVSELRRHRSIVSAEEPTETVTDSAYEYSDVIAYGYDEVSLETVDDSQSASYTEAAVQPTYEVRGSYYIGVLEIPAISLELPIADNCAMSTLRYTPGCYYGSAATSDLVLGAHNYKSHFGYLHRLSSGHEVIFTDVNGIQYNYQVVEVTEVSPYSSETVCTSGHDLAMFTCNSSGARRVVVYCDLVE